MVNKMCNIYREKKVKKKKKGGESSNDRVIGDRGWVCFNGHVNVGKGGKGEGGREG